MDTPASSVRVGALRRVTGMAPLTFQLCLTAIVIAAMALMPARDGAMLVVPLTGAPAKPWLDQRRDIAFSGIGKLPGSLVVIADRNALFLDAMVHGALLLPAVPTLCAGQSVGQTSGKPS